MKQAWQRPKNYLYSKNQKPSWEELYFIVRGLVKTLTPSSKALNDTTGVCVGDQSKFE